MFAVRFLPNLLPDTTNPSYNLTFQDRKKGIIREGLAVIAAGILLCGLCKAGWDGVEQDPVDIPVVGYCTLEKPYVLAGKLAVTVNFDNKPVGTVVYRESQGPYTKEEKIASPGRPSRMVGGKQEFQPGKEEPNSLFRFDLSDRPPQTRESIYISQDLESARSIAGVDLRSTTVHVQSHCGEVAVDMSAGTAQIVPR